MPKTKPPSFFALISDIHSNIDALDAVLADLEKWPCRGILCLGDIVGGVGCWPRTPKKIFLQRFSLSGTRRLLSLWFCLGGIGEYSWRTSSPVKSPHF